MTATAIIPARGGSKGIPRKNLEEVGGLSLVARAIRTCLASQRIESVIVSSDDSEILEEAHREGARVVLRPTELSNDSSRSEDALLHAIESSTSIADIIAFVECTSPFINPKDLDEAISLVHNGDFDTVFSVSESDALLWAGKPDNLRPVNHNPFLQTMRQERSGQFIETGAFYCFQTKRFLENRLRFSGRIGGLVVPMETNLEIDYPVDLAVAQAIEDFTRER